MIRAAIVLIGAIAALITVASHAKADNNPFSGATSIDMAMTRDVDQPINISKYKAKIRHLARNRNTGFGTTIISSTTNEAAKINIGPETCIASEYGVGDGYHGKRAADGSIFNTYASAPYTVAHRTRRLGSYVTVTNLATGLSIRAKVTDRGPFYHARCVDVGRAGALAIGMSGLAKVTVR